MKRFYRQYLNLRLWFLRRRLRDMGFREIADLTTAETLVRLQMEATETQKLFIEWIKIGLLAVVALSLWLILGLRVAEPVQIDLPPQLPDKIAPGRSDFGDPTLPAYRQPQHSFSFRTTPTTDLSL